MRRARATINQDNININIKIIHETLEEELLQHIRD